MMLGDKLRDVAQRAYEESRKQPAAEDPPEMLPAWPMTGRMNAHLILLPIAVFLALLVIGTTVVSTNLTTYGSPANVIAEMLGFVFELAFLTYMVLLGIGFGIAKVVEAIKGQHS
jgi:hypothetical protein